MTITANDGRKISRETLEHFRTQALKLRKKGWKINDIAESFGLHRGSVSRWFTKHKREGIGALKRKKAKGPEHKLNKKQIKKILSCLKKPATEYGFETELWDCTRVNQLIKNVCKIELHVSNVWRMLKSWNFTPQKPERKAYEQNDADVKKWLETEWPEIQKHARRWQAIIYFQDESGISLIPSVGRTWAQKGKTPIIRTTANRGGLCLTSAISPAGRMVFRIETGKVNAQKHVEFFQQILKRHPSRKIIVIEDRAPAHRANKVKEFIGINKKRFARYFIPPYSPELNPDEKTWRYLKKHKLKAHTASTTNVLKGIVLSKMRSIQRRPAVIRSFFYGSYVT